MTAARRLVNFSITNAAEFFNLVLQLKLNVEEKGALVAYMRQL